MSKDNYRELKRQAKQSRIFVTSTKYSAYTSKNVPSDHKETFAIIQSLGRTSFDRYGYTANNETQDKPWQLQNKNRASKLVHYAAKCRRENRNEAGWRNEVEFRLLERFDIEISCKRCRKRLWRSEIEANPSSSNSKTTSLNERQRKREPCKCNPTGRVDCMDPGTSELFSSRIQETVCQIGQTDLLSPNPKKQPDRIHGLQRTTNFENLLQEPYAHDNLQQYPRRLIEEVVKTSITLENGGDPLLFPFLVVEAKGEKGAENFEHMEIQTAFPIKNALHLQYDLLKTRGNTMDVPGGPLVWFLANRGEDWRVYGAVVYEEEERPNYLINFLWSGSITGHDDALQLILIVDYILDWARDIYRPNILRQLTMLKTTNLNDSMTCGADPDVYSLREEVQPWMEGQIFEPEDIIDPNISDATSITLEEETPDSLSQFTKPQGLVRDARVIESRIRSLYITRDNSQTLLQGFENPNTAMRFARSILATMNRRCIVLDSEDVLNAIEDKWTGNVRARTSFSSQRSRVYAQFRVSYFMNHTWEQIRELTYLAISEDAREILVETANLRFAVRNSRFTPPECAGDKLIRRFVRFLQRSVRTDFISALARRTYSVNMEEYDHDLNDQPLLRLISKRDKDKKSPGVSMHGIVYAIYEKYRIGNREPSEPFIRVSTRVDCEGRSLWRDGNRPIGHEIIDKMLVYGDIQKAAAAYLPHGSEQKLCLYVLDEKSEQLDHFSITLKLLSFLFKDHIYGTVRKGKVYRTSRNWQDNRTAHYFTMKEAESHLHLSREILRQDIFDWVIELNSLGEPSSDFDTVVREVEADLRQWAQSRDTATS